MRTILLRSLHLLLPMGLILMLVAPLDVDFGFTFPWYAIAHTAETHLDIATPAVLNLLWPIQVPCYALYLSWATGRHRLRESLLLLILLHLCAIQTNLILLDLAGLQDAGTGTVRVLLR